MILVADSGSTKCDWILLDRDGAQLQTKTMGFNPFFHSSAVIEEALRQNDLIMGHASEVDAVFFYGAGCSSPERNQVVENALSSVFQDLNSCVVDHDLLGACLATSGTEEGIACILGTGSNSCYFDGSKAHEERPSLGYILGDEGSGAYFGRILLRDWLYSDMPIELNNAFAEYFDVSKEKIFSAVYNRPNANVYLASFMCFVSDHRTHPYFRKMIYEGLSSFARIHIQCFDRYKEVPVHFVGSIAYYFRDVLEEVAKYHRFKVGNVIKKPIEAMASYHWKQYFEPGQA